MEILKSTQKPLLTESPFVKYLYIGANDEGYWNSYHMSLPFEDVVDCLRILYPDFDFVFLFDHSQGHGRKHDGGLNHASMFMSRAFGGAQPMMRGTTILSDGSYLGPHLPKLKSDDAGPWYLSDDQGEAKRHDQRTGRSTRVKRSKKLSKQLE